MILILSILVFKDRIIKLPKYFVYLAAFLLTHTLIIGSKNHILFDQIKSIVGILIYALVFILYVSDKQRFKSLIKAYYSFIFIISVFALIQVLLFSIANIEFALPFAETNIEGKTLFRHEVLDLLPRAFGISSEPAHFAEILLPAIGMILYSIVYKENQIVKIDFTCIVIFVAYLLTFSLIAYSGLLLTLIMLFIKKIQFVRFVLISIIILLFSFLSIKYIKPINERITSLISFNINQFGTSDLSSFAIISNALVTKSALVESHLLGNGLNSHPLSYDKYIGSYMNSLEDLMPLNKDDAASTYLRILSELGILGIIVLLIFLKKYRIPKREIPISFYGIINDISLIYILISFIRSGKFISILLWLFVALYYYSYVFELKKENSEG